MHIHNIAEEYAKNNHFIFLTGEAKHPEMLGTISFCGESYFVIENEEQVNTAIEKFKKSNKKKALIISQTTYSLEKFQNIVETIKKNIPLEKIEIKNTICNATKQRQEETEEMAKQKCIEYGLLSPIYEFTNRGGCWFCPNQRYKELRHLRDNHFDLWKRLLDLYEKDM